ncbi:MAG: TAXI family TRAP transporter solute-binding subunit [Thermodesulfobacteriota bacterium]|nr:TAXI family TRAP transporter solute-binding subunit [Thermodesulfobacteriota bacterium]
MKRFKIIFLCLAVTFLLLSSVAFAQKIDLKMMTGPMGGSWYPLGGAIADSVQRDIPGVTLAVAPGGGVANVEAIELGKCDIGFSNSSSGVDGVYGRPPFKEKMTNMRQLANLYPQYFQIVVLEGSGIKSVADLKGKVISPGPKGFTGEFAARQVLEIHGLSYKDMSKVQHVGYTDTVALMKDGHCDGWLFCTTIPGASVMDLASARKIRLISLPDDKIKEMQKLNAGYIRRLIPKGTYEGVDYDVPTFGFFTHLIISAKLPDDLVYKITKTIVKDLPRLGDIVKDMKGVTAKDLAMDIGIPFHPGALKYYKEIGAL